MEQVTVYRAFDGKQFDAEEECLEYERNILPQCNAMKNLLLFDEETLLIPFEPDMTYSDLYDKTQFFVITNKTGESLACLQHIIDQGPYDCPDPIEEGHVYTWSNSVGWYDYGEEFCQMKETVDIIISTVEFNKDLRKRIEQTTEST